MEVAAISSLYCFLSSVLKLVIRLPLHTLSARRGEQNELFTPQIFYIQSI